MSFHVVFSHAVVNRVINTWCINLVLMKSFRYYKCEEFYSVMGINIGTIPLLFFLGKIVRKRWSDRNSIFLNDVLGIAQMLITLNMTIIIFIYINAFNSLFIFTCYKCWINPVGHLGLVASPLNFSGKVPTSRRGANYSNRQR